MGVLRTPLSPTDAALACPACCPCVCHVARPGLELRWVPLGGYEDGPRVPCRASPLRTSRSRPSPPSLGQPPVVLTSYRSTAERKLLPPLKPPKPTRVRQDVTSSGDAPQPDLDLPSEDGIQTGTEPPGSGPLGWEGASGLHRVEVEHSEHKLTTTPSRPWASCSSTSCCSGTDRSCSFYSNGLCWAGVRRPGLGILEAFSLLSGSLSRGQSRWRPSERSSSHHGGQVPNTPTLIPT